jgi:hypothetical protein
MKVLILYRERSEYRRRVDEFIHDFKRQYPDASVEVQDLDTREGAATASLYDIPVQPVVMALQEDGRLIQSWPASDHMPLMQEVAHYAYA